MSVNTLDVPQKSPPDTPSPTTNDSALTDDSNYIGAADQMLDNEQPLEDPLDETDDTESDQETRFNDLPEPSVDIDGKYPSDDKPQSHNDDYIGAADRMLDNEQSLSREDTATIGQDVQMQHLVDQQLTQNDNTETIRINDGPRSTEIGQLAEKAFGAKESTPVNTSWQSNEFSIGIQEGFAGPYSYSGDFPEKTDVIDASLQELSLQRAHGLDLRPLEQGIGVAHAGQWLADAPLSYMDPLQVKPALQQPIEPANPERLPADDTPSANNENPSNGERSPDGSLLRDNSLRNADSATVLQLTSASSTEDNNESTSNDHATQDSTKAAGNAINRTTDEASDNEGPGETETELDNAGAKPLASKLERYAQAQGWTKVQTPQGPPKYVDENGTVRMTIKKGSPRTPGSGSPHVEIRDKNGQRIDPGGNPVNRKSPGNHTAIEWDF